MNATLEAVALIGCYAVVNVVAWRMLLRHLQHIDRNAPEFEPGWRW